MHVRRRPLPTAAAAAACDGAAPAVGHQGAVVANKYPGEFFLSFPSETPLRTSTVVGPGLSCWSMTDRDRARPGCWLTAYLL